MSSHFERDTSVRDRGDGHFTAGIHPRWFVAGGANGGYVAAIILRALTKTLADPERRIRTLTIHYPTAAREGPIALACREERAGRSVSTLSARVEQEGKLVAIALAAFSTPWRGGLEFDQALPPPLGEPSSIAPLSAPDMPPFTDNFEFRFARGPAPFSGADVAETGGWMRPAEPVRLDDLLLATYADAWLPAVLTMTTPTERLLLPTIELTIHFRHPIESREDPLVQVAFTTRLAAEGFFEEDGMIWDRRGRLLANARQLALVLPWPETP